MDDRPTPSVTSPPATAPRVRWTVAGMAVVVAAAAAPVPTQTWQSTAVTAVIGLVAVVATVLWRLRRRPAVPSTPARRSPVPRSGWRAAPWILVFVAVTALELGALAYGDRPAFPTVSWLLGPWFVEPAVRFAGYVGWICLGYWLVRR